MLLLDEIARRRRVRRRLNELAQAAERRESFYRHCNEERHSPVGCEWCQARRPSYKAW